MIDTNAGPIAAMVRNHPYGGWAAAGFAVARPPTPPRPYLTRPGDELADTTPSATPAPQSPTLQSRSGSESPYRHGDPVEATMHWLSGWEDHLVRWDADILKREEAVDTDADMILLERAEVGRRRQQLEQREARLARHERVLQIREDKHEKRVTKHRREMRWGAEEENSRRRKRERLAAEMKRLVREFEEAERSGRQDLVAEEGRGAPEQ